MTNRLLNTVRGIAGAYIAYPIAEKIEKREITVKVDELRKYYTIPYEQRKVMALDKLVKTLEFAGRTVPYYIDLFKSMNFDPRSLYDDINNLQNIPYLTKDIIREQGDRLLAAPLESIRHHVRKTGGSTGASATIYYDQIGLDYSAAVTRYARERIGHTASQSELHFAASFAKPPKTKLPTKDDVKNFALNRSNAFFDRLDDIGLSHILQTLKERHPHLVHGHPSTLYALACYVEKEFGSLKVFDIFESSGELFQPYMREKIAKALKCQTIDRYGSAEFGVIGYELDGHENGLQVLDSEGWAESRKTEVGDELVFTGFHNRLMPLIRYATGDMAKILEKGNGVYMSDVVGRIHDMVDIGGVQYPTHNIMDVMDHIIGGIQEFQIDMTSKKPLIRIVAEKTADIEQIQTKIINYWKDTFNIKFVGHDDFIRVGQHAKFRHVVYSELKIKNIFFDISALEDIAEHPTGISRVMLSLIRELVKFYPDININGISFRTSGTYELVSLHAIQMQSNGYLDEMGMIEQKNDLLISDGDTIILLGEQWLFETSISTLQEIKKNNNIKIASLIHDLVPFFMPELYWNDFPETYKKCIQDLVEISNTLLVYSNNTKNDLLKYFPFLKDHKYKNIEIIRLGENLSYSIENPKQKNYILCVGTIQPRKNHIILLHVWRKLFNEFGEKCPELIIAGSIGWSSDDLIYFFKNSSQLKNKIQIIENTTDEELALLYAQCRFTVYPSLYEGWGLPIRESLANNKFAIVSNTSSMTEVGGIFCEYFDPNDSGELYDLIKKYFFDEELLMKKEKVIHKEYFPVSWKDTMEQFMSIIREM